MIHIVVPAIHTELNNFLKSKHNINEEKVVMSNLVNADGSMAVQETDKIVLTIANIDQDRSQSNTGKYETTSRGSFSKVRAPINIHLYLLFSAYFTPENYVEGLKFISSTIAFFQSRGGIFDPQNTPQLAGYITKLNAELVPMDFRELSNVWGAVGAKYMPSVLYRLKSIPIEHRLSTPDIPSINKL